MAEVAEVIYYTDPGSPWSWAAEPVLRRLEWEFADQVAITYVLAPDGAQIGDGTALLLDALDAAAASAMPVDARAWAGRKGRAPRSVYPACLAVKAAAEQGLARGMLRAVLEALWLRRGAADTPDALEALGREVAGLDHARFAIALRSSAIVEAFGADLERSREVAAPAFEVGGVRMEAGGVREAVIGAGKRPRGLPSVESVLDGAGGVATAEVVAATGLPWPRAAQRLWSLAADHRVRAERIGGGELWHPTG